MSYSGKGSSQGGGSKGGGSSCHKDLTSGRDDQLPPHVRNNPKTSLSTAKAGSPYTHLSFIVRIEPLKPKYGDGGQSPRRTEEGYFQPPNRKEGYARGDGPPLMLRWMGGRVFEFPRDDPIRNVTPPYYRAATVFTQHQDTSHLLAVPFDATQRNVRDVVRGWKPISFNHQRIGATNHYFTYVSCLGAEAHIAAPGSVHWMPQLLPDRYQCHATDVDRVQAGLIGNLPLLFALAAFSAPPTALRVLLSSVQPGAWNPHNHPYPTGHIFERGMVVTVYLDPGNPNHSVKESLDSLQDGGYGAFYGPQRPPATSSLTSSSTASSTAYATGPAAGSSTGYR